MSSLPQYDLSLADGSRWVIAAGDETAAPIVDRLAAAMMLPLHTTPGRCLWVVSDETAALPTGDDLYHVLRPVTSESELFSYFIEISLVIARRAQANGGVLLHGALAACPPLSPSPLIPIPSQSFDNVQSKYREMKWVGEGVILAAPGGTGKTTASGRFPSPWRSLCDDATLVVRDAAGQFWAHPWPTWSRFMADGPGGAWNTPQAVPLRAVFFLSRNDSDRVEPVGSGQSVTLLVQTAEQASRLMERGQPTEQRRAIWLERFDNLCALAKSIPAYILHISLEGAFWVEIEKVISDQ